MLYCVDGEWWATTLDDLYPQATPLADISPLFRGMKHNRWCLLMVERLANEERAAAQPIDPADAPLTRQALATARSNHGYQITPGQYGKRSQ